MNSTSKTSLRLAFFVMMLLPFPLSAQLSQGGLPWSFSHAIAPDTNNIVIVAPPVTEALAAEDQKSPLPYRYALNLPVDLGMGTAGQWTAASSGMTVWRLNVKSQGAKALILYFDRYNIPEGGKVFIYNPGRTQLLGAFTQMNNNKLSTFAAGLIYGDELTIEYNAPAGLPMAELHVSEVGYAYRGVAEYTGVKTGFGSSGPCEVNVNCSEGAQWQNQQRSVARINVKRGGSSVWCTGSLVNNVRNDGKPYVLTADHCGTTSSTDLSQWIFYFGYQSAGCPDPTKEPALHSMTGATLVAHGGNAASAGSDFFLLLLNAAVPDSFNAYFNGWSRENIPPSPSGTGIHHPQGDIKKISTYTAPLQPAFWTGGSKLAHWKVTWAQTANGHGTTEGGSSGSPLFDNQGRLVGTLTGGDSSCDSALLDKPDYYGMFSYSWDKNGTDSTDVLKYWLDPDNTGVVALNGWALSVQESESNDWITFFPNPVSDQLNIKVSSPERMTLHCTIHDILGNPCLVQDLSSVVNPEMQIDLSGFARGVYLLRINDGDRQVVRKIIKK